MTNDVIHRTILSGKSVSFNGLYANRHARNKILAEFLQAVAKTSPEADALTKKYFSANEWVNKIPLHV